MKKLTVALAGNPNSGKTTIFNSLTGERQHVGNYPGVTVEKIEGNLKYDGYDIELVDLPGTYSLNAYSLDEIIAREFILNEKPDIVINIIDLSNLERNLYLTTQLKELDLPLILVFNMADLSEKCGLSIDKKRLSELLGVPIVLTVATKKKGMDKLLEAIVKMAEGKTKLPETTVHYGQEIEEDIEKLKAVISQDDSLTARYPVRWLALKLLENDREVMKKIKESPREKEILELAGKSIVRLKGIFGDEVEALITDYRYGFISGACSEAVIKTCELRHTISDQIDRVLLNRILGIPIFLVMIWLMFKFTFEFSRPMVIWIEIGQRWLGNFITALLADGSVFQSLAVDGLIGGVGAVLTFVPIIFLLYLAIAILEDSGYLARVAFITDKFMHKIGLHGRSCIPMLLGFGCNIPAILATRTIEDKKDRLVTILVNPFMSCGARLPVYTLLIGVFFDKKIAGNILFSLYLIGIVTAIAVAKLFRKYLFKGEAHPFVMELPPYRLPAFKGLLVHTLRKISLYLKKAGTIIFAGCVIVWFLSNFPWPSPGDYNVFVDGVGQNEGVVNRAEEDKTYERLKKSYAGNIGRGIAPALKPLGFGDWKIAVALIGGLAGKEIIVGTLGTLYAVNEKGEKSLSLRQSLQEERASDGTKIYNPLSAYSLMVFILLYVPCIGTLAVIKKETHSWHWPLFVIIYTAALAWIISFVVYQGGKFLGFGL